MKTIKLFLLCIILGFSFSLLAQNQNQNAVWSMTPKYYDFSTGLPQPLPTFSTNFNASNMQLDANGDILFYVVDNDLFDGDGDQIGNFWNYFRNTYYDFNIEYVPNTSEIVIIPDPANCGRYYILASSVTYSGCNQTGVSSFPIGPDPYVAILDFNVVRPNNSSKLGAITSVERVVDLPSMPPFVHSWQGSPSGGVEVRAFF